MRIDPNEVIVHGIGSTDELIELVRKWGDDKRLYSPLMQFAKIVEELGELAHEITRDRVGDGGIRKPSKETVDAVGDILVTIIVWCNIVGLDPMACLAVAYNEIKDREGETVHGSFIKN